MLVLPAIDLLGGRCVRLLRGDFGAPTVYPADPPAMAAALAAAGARALHVVDLDGAREGRPVQARTIAAIVEACGVPVQVGGGLRRLADVERVLERGAWRAIVGTAAVRDPTWMAEAVRRLGAERVCAAVDVRGGEVLAAGWREEAGVPLGRVLDQLGGSGVRALLATAVTRDGALAGPDLSLYRRLIGPAFEVTAAGGIASAADLRALAELGLAGAVVGRALYEGRLTAGDLGALSRELAGRAAPDDGSAPEAGFPRDVGIEPGGGTPREVGIGPAGGS